MGQRSLMAHQYSRALKIHSAVSSRLSPLTASCLGLAYVALKSSAQRSLVRRCALGAHPNASIHMRDGRTNKQREEKGNGGTQMCAPILPSGNIGSRWPSEPRMALPSSSLKSVIRYFKESLRMLSIGGLLLQ